MKQIQLSRGFVALVDDEDFERLNQHKWHAADVGRGVIYAARNITIGPYKQRKVYMHREICGNHDLLTDHKNGDGLDNRRFNLRKATNAQNQYNRRPEKGKNVPFKGVTYSGNLQQPYCARVRHNGKEYRLGLFSTAQEAAQAYDRKAFELRGAYARLNCPELFFQNNSNLVENSLTNIAT